MYREHVKRGRLPGMVAATPIHGRQGDLPIGVPPGGRESRSSLNASEANANRRANYLFDVRQRNSMPGQVSPNRAYNREQSAKDNSSTASMSNVCMQIATQALSKCYNIMPEEAQ